MSMQCHKIAVQGHNKNLFLSSNLDQVWALQYLTVEFTVTEN